MKINPQNRSVDSAIVLLCVALYSFGMRIKLLKIRKLSLLGLGIIIVAIARFAFPAQENSVYTGDLIDAAHADIPYNYGTGFGGTGDAGGGGGGDCGGGGGGCGV